jgi:signal peptidase I
MKNKENNMKVDVGNIVLFEGKEYVVNGWDSGCIEIIELGDLVVIEEDKLEVIGELNG